MNARKTEPKVSIGVLIFLISMVAIIVVAAPMQRAWGMMGLVLTELMLLALAVIPVWILKWPFKDVFPIKVPRLREIFGVLVLWLGSYLLVHVTTIGLFYLYPAGMGEVSTGLSDFFTAVPLPVALLAVAVLPGICEEFLHRGVLQYTFRGKPKWVTIISMALLFGLFHLDPYRFIGTAMLGGVLTSIMLETNNLLLPIFMHVFNNALSTSLAFVSGTGTSSSVSLATLGSSLVMASIAPFLFILGRRLLLHNSRRKVKPITRKTWAIVTLIALLMVVGGSFLVSYSHVEPVFVSSLTQQVAAADRGHELLFTVEETGTYQLDLTIEGADRLLTTFAILASDGEEVYSVTAGALTVNAEIVLQADEYAVSIAYDHSGLMTEYLPVKIDILIQ